MRIFWAQKVSQNVILGGECPPHFFKEIFHPLPSLQTIFKFIELRVVRTRGMTCLLAKAWIVLFCPDCVRFANGRKDVCVMDIPRIQHRSQITAQKEVGLFSLSEGSSPRVGPAVTGLAANFRSGAILSVTLLFSWWVSKKRVLWATRGNEAHFVRIYGRESETGDAGLSASLVHVSFTRCEWRVYVWYPSMSTRRARLSGVADTLLYTSIFPNKRTEDGCRAAHFEKIHCGTC